MHLRLLGSLEVDGEPGPGGRRDRTVLVQLALAAGTVVTVDELSGALWGDEIPASAAKVVQGCVVRLRKRLGPDAIETVAGGYRLRTLRDQIDVHRFAQLIERAREVGAAGDPERSVHLVGDALALWRENTLVELDAAGVDLGEQQRLVGLHLDAEELHLEQLLECGSRADLPVLGQELVRAAPYRERRWALLALAQYRAARQADALATLSTARTVLVGDLGLDPGPELTELEAAILRHDAALRPQQEGVDLDPADEACPFRGLLPYDVEDRALYFGRDAAVSAALDRLLAGSLSVIGASGSGKSSLVRAGIAAALRDEGRGVEVITPGSDPVDRLRRLVERAPRATTIVIDQFEEVLTLERRDDLMPLLDLLEAWVAHSPLVLTLRADRLGEVNEHPRLAALVERNVLLVSPLGPDELREAVEGPARVAGLRVEPGLVEVIVRDVGREPGALPLLSHVLRAVWLHREGRTLTLAGYDAAGGLQGAIAATAEEVYAQLDPGQVEAVRLLMLRLFHLTPDGEHLRRRVPLDVVDQSAALRDAVDRLARARLVVVDRDGVTVAHEALASAWPRLADWLGQEDEHARLRQHLAAATLAWEDMGRAETELYRGPRLAAAQEWGATHAEALTVTEQAFLDAAVAADDRQRQALHDELAERASSNRRLRRAVLAVAGLLVVALTTGAVAVLQTRRAEESRDRARAGALASAQAGLVASADSVRPSRRDLAALLAVEAERLAPGPEARSALFRTFTDEPAFLGYDPVAGVNALNTAVVAAVPVTERSHVVATNTGALWSMETDATSIAIADAAGDGASGSSWLAVDDDRQRVAHLFLRDRAELAGDPSVLRILEVQEKAILATITLADNPTSVALSPDGEYVAVAGGRSGALRLFASATGRPLGVIDGPDLDAVPLATHSGAVAFGLDGRLFWAALDGPVQALSVPDLRITSNLATPDDLAAPTQQLIVVDQDTLVGVSWSDSTRGTPPGLVAWDLVDGERLWARAPSAGCTSAVSTTGSGVVHCADRFGRIEPIDARTGMRRGPIVDFQKGPVAAMTSDLGGGELVAFGGSPPVRARWDVSGGGLLVRAAAPDLTPLAYDADGHNLLAVAYDGPAVVGPFLPPSVVDPVTGAVIDPLRGAEAGTWIGPGLLAVIRDGGSVSAHDVATGADRPWGPTSPDEPLEEPLRVAYDAAGGRLAIWTASTIGDGYVITVVDSATGEVLDDRIGLEYGEVPDAAEFSDDGRYLVTASTAGVAVFDGPSGEVVARGAAGPVMVTVGPGGLLALGDRSGAVQLVDVESLEPVVPTLTGANGEIQDLDFSDDGSMLMVRGGDAVRLFDVASGAQLGGPIAVARPDPDEGAALAPDGGQLAVAAEAGVALWDLDVDHLAAAACQVAGRNLTHAEWDRYIGPLAPYHFTCPEHTAPI